MTRLGSMMIALCLTALSALPALAQQATGTAPNPDYGYRHDHMWGWHGGMMFHPLLTVLVVVAIIALIARASGWSRRHGYGYDRRRSDSGALAILEERFARGEIDKAEFEERRKTLGR
jgi:putative membrane protein